MLHLFCIFYSSCHKNMWYEYIVLWYLRKNILRSGTYTRTYCVLVLTYVLQVYVSVMQLLCTQLGRHRLLTPLAFPYEFLLIFSNFNVISDCPMGKSPCSIVNTLRKTGDDVNLSSWGRTEYLTWKVISNCFAIFEQYCIRRAFLTGS